MKNEPRPAAFPGNPASIPFVWNGSCMRKIAIILLSLVSATSLFAQAATPSPTDQGKAETPAARRPAKQGIWDRLNLTDDQRAKLKQIREADRESLRSARAQVKIAKELLKAALLANPENVADIQTKATNLANALSASSAQTALHYAKVSAVLTPAQRVELAEALEHRLRDWHRRPGGGPQGPWRERSPGQAEDESLEP
jgi:Spy/CpxP family protein refolding chaperone